MGFEELEAQLQEGTLDSVGRFTIDLASRAQKFAGLVGLEPCIFLGRLLQAATVGRVNQIRYSVSAKGIRVQLHARDGTEFDAFKPYVLGELPPPGSVRHYLELAFSSALALKPKKLTWTCLGSCADLLTESSAPVKRDEAKAVLEFEWSTTEGWLVSVKRMLSGRLQVLEFLNKHCCFSVIPVFVDGRRLQFSSSFSRWDPVVNRSSLSDSIRCISMELCSREADSRTVINGPAPSWRMALRAKIAGRRSLCQTTSKDTLSRLSSLLPAYDLLSMLLLKINLAYSLDVQEVDVRALDVPDRGRFVTGLFYAKAINVEETEVRLRQAVYLEAPDTYLTDPVNLETTQVCCSRFLALHHQPIVGDTLDCLALPVRVVVARIGEVVTPPSCLVLVRDGLAIVRECPEQWRNGRLVVIPIPQCRVDIEEWRVVKDEFYQQLLEELDQQFQHLESEDRYSNRVS